MRTARSLAQIGGVVVVILGLHMMGMLRIPWLMMDARVHLQPRTRVRFGLRGLVGMAFAAGWSPCIGPILAGILAIASQQHSGASRAVACVLLVSVWPCRFWQPRGAIGGVLPLLRRIKRLRFGRSSSPPARF